MTSRSVERRLAIQRVESREVRVQIVHGGVGYAALVTREGDGGRNVTVYARCAACNRMRAWSDSTRLARYSSRFERIVHWPVTKAWPRAVRDRLSAAIRRELRRAR